jgi:hypothetical protein
MGCQCRPHCERPWICPAREHLCRNHLQSRGFFSRPRQPAPRWRWVRPPPTCRTGLWCCRPARGRRLPRQHLQMLHLSRGRQLRPLIARQIILLPPPEAGTLHSSRFQPSPRPVVLPLNHLLRPLYANLPFSVRRRMMTTSEMLTRTFFPHPLLTSSHTGGTMRLL